MRNVLIIGANGFTGRHLLKYLLANSNYNLIGCSRNDDIAPEKGYTYIKVDICDAKALNKVFEQVKPDVVVNTAALSVPDYCETHRDEAFEVNAQAVENIAKLCEIHSCRFIHLSTDFVLSGKIDQLHTEDEEPEPVNYYGVTKWEGEKLIAAHCSSYAIARVVVVYGKALPGQHGNIVQLVANKLNAGETINVVSDQWRTPTYVGDIAIGVKKLIEIPENGIFHICGSDYLSIADIAFRTAEILKLDKSLINPVTTEVMQEKTIRPQYSGLSIEKARELLDYNPLTFEEGVANMFE